MLFTSEPALSFAVDAAAVAAADAVTDVAAVDALDIVPLLASDVTISVFTPFTVFTMVEQLVCGAEDVVEEEVVVDVVCD